MIFYFNLFLIQSLFLFFDPLLFISTNIMRRQKQNQNKIIMNLLPSIHKPKTGFKFSNPLAGVTYNNNSYLVQCHYEPDPQKQQVKPKRNSHQMPSSLYQNTVTMKNKNERNSSLKKRPCYLTKTSDSKINYSMMNTKSPNDEIDATKLNKKVFKFPDIEVKVIDEIKSSKDYFQKNLKINLGHYFGMFFRKNLVGPISQDLIEIVQKYLLILVTKNKLDSPVQMKDYPAEYFNLKSKRAFVERIQQLEVKKYFKPIEQMIKYYCVPTRQFRISCLRDILHMLTQTLYEKFNLSKDKEYKILDQNGKLLEDVCDIKFSTSVLLITNNPHYQKAYHLFKNIVQSNLQNFKKVTFSEQLKKSFRSVIVAGKFQQSKESPPKQPMDGNDMRRKAQSKLEMYRNSDSPTSKFNPAKTTNYFGGRSKSRQKVHYHVKQKDQSASGHSLNKTEKKPRTLSGKKRDQIYLTAFDQLWHANNTYDLAFNHLNSKKLLMKVLKTEFSLFKKKTEHQVNAIIKAFRIDPNSLSITWQQFQTINEVANCKGETEQIVSFVSKYLPFNEYGQMDKPTLGKTLQFLLNDVVGEQVVLQIIWSWFQKNNLIENNVLVRNTLESWYIKHKMAFVILVSLIFGTNQTSWIDMAYEVLI